MTQPDRPPLGSWARAYALVIVLAVLTMWVLHWMTLTWQIPLPR